MDVVGTQAERCRQSPGSAVASVSRTHYSEHLRGAGTRQPREGLRVSSARTVGVRECPWTLDHRGGICMAEPLKIDQLDEIDEQESIPFRYQITSYGADYPVSSLVERLRKGAVFVPEYQRGYVWNRRRASRFVESLLLGLPVPGIFLTRDGETQQLLIVDGQQRLKTLLFFYDGVFKPDAREFSLSLSTPSSDEPGSPYEGLTYEGLRSADQLRLDDSIIHATIIRQDAPDVDELSATYDIFERLNTETDQLRPQEIRTCVYHGRFVGFLSELNELPAWRTLFGRVRPDKRMRDQELLLRFLALYSSGGGYRKPMKKFLNTFMGAHRDADNQTMDAFKSNVTTTIGLMASALGPNAVRAKSKTFNAAVFDAVAVGLARRLERGGVKDSQLLVAAHRHLLAEPDFIDSVSRATSDDEQVTKRVRLATEAFASLD